MSPSSPSPSGAGIAAGSIALIGFGLDSLVEVAAGTVIVWLFTGRRLADPERAERRAQQLIAVSFYLLAAYIAVESARDLIAGDHPDASWVGIGLAAVTAPTMPLLARAKQRIGHELGSSATVSEGAQNMLCAYLSVALLIGLGANAVFGLWWADPARGARDRRGGRARGTAELARRRLRLLRPFVRHDAYTHPPART